jgi:hypothetical protein
MVFVQELGKELRNKTLRLEDSRNRDEVNVSWFIEAIEPTTKCLSPFSPRVNSIKSLDDIVRYLNSRLDKMEQCLEFMISLTGAAPVALLRSSSSGLRA